MSDKIRTVVLKMSPLWVVIKLLVVIVILTGWPSLKNF